jgi:hypothetical protein
MSALQAVVNSDRQTQAKSVRAPTKHERIKAAMEAAGLLVRIKDEKRVDQLPMLMEAYPKQAILLEKVTGCDTDSG